MCRVPCWARVPWKAHSLYVGRVGPSCVLVRGLSWHCDLQEEVGKDWFRFQVVCWATGGCVGCCLFGCCVVGGCCFIAGCCVFGGVVSLRVLCSWGCCVAGRVVSLGVVVWSRCCVVRVVAFYRCCVLWMLCGHGIVSSSGCSPCV